MVSATINAPRRIAEKYKQDQDYQDDAFGQVVQHRVRGEVHQVAAVEKRHDLDSGGRMRSLSSSTLSWMASRVASASAPLRSSTMPSTTSSLSTILPSARWIAFPICPRRILGPCSTVPMSRTRMGVPFWVLITVCFDVVERSRTRPDGADVDLL